MIVVVAQEIFVNFSNDLSRIDFTFIERTENHKIRVGVDGDGRLPTRTITLANVFKSNSNKRLFGE